MRQIHMQKTLRNAENLCVKNSVKCGKFMCKKHCEMREIYMRKTLRNASNLDAKNSAKCGKFMCKKHSEMRYLSANFPYIFCI